jgi:hypothetical protein
MNRLKVPLTIGVAICFNAFGRAQSLNIDLNTDFGPPEGGRGAPSSSFGAAADQVGFWDTFLVQTQSPKLLRGLNGALTNVLMTGPSGGTGGGNNNPLNTGDYALLLNDAHAVGTSTFSWTGLANGNYRIFTYAVRPNGGISSASVTYTGSITTNPQIVTGPMPGNQFILGITHCIHDVVVTNSTLSMTIVMGPENPAYLNGLQIVAVPEPASVASLFLGSMLLASRRRRRR